MKLRTYFVLDASNKVVTTVTIPPEKARFVMDRTGLKLMRKLPTEQRALCLIALTLAS